MRIVSGMHDPDWNQRLICVRDLAQGCALRNVLVDHSEISTVFNSLLPACLKAALFARYKLPYYYYYFFWPTSTKPVGTKTLRK